MRRYLLITCLSALLFAAARAEQPRSRRSSPPVMRSASIKLNS